MENSQQPQKENIEKKNLKPLDEFLKEHPDITIKEAMDMGYSYNEIIFG